MHRILPGHQCVSAQHCGWGGIRNGELLERAEAEFDLFITADQNIQYQQNLAKCRIAILQVSTNKLEPILAAAPLIRDAVTSIRPESCASSISRERSVRTRNVRCTSVG
jgi:hypothetical protein